MKNLKIFESYLNYNVGEQLPNVSYCRDNKKVYYNPENLKIIVKYNITDSGTFRLLNSNYNNVIYSIIDNELISLNNGEYTFTEPGEYTITYHINTKLLGNNMFKDCTNLISVTIPNNKIDTIGNETFSGCTNLKSITLRSNIKNIGDKAFYNCISLENINLSNIIHIGVRSFYKCEKINSVNIHNVTEIPEGVFLLCKKLTTIEIPNGITEIGSTAFIGCNLSKIKIPNTVVTIGNSAFADNQYLTEINIPNSVTTLGTLQGNVYGPFANCGSLEDVIISKNIETIGYGTFKLNKNIKNIYIKSKTPPEFGDEWFPELNLMLSNLNIYVPEDSVESYQQAIPSFASKIKPIIGLLLEEEE